MAQFEYTGQLSGGSAIAGTLESDSLIDARNQLEDMGMNVLSLTQAQRMPVRRPLSAEDFQFFNEQLASLAKTGIALEPGLRRLARDVGSARLRRVFTHIADELARGISLEQAIAQRRGQFPALYAQIIQAGVQSGQLAATLYNLNTHLRLVGQTRRMVWEVAGYPLVVFGLALAILTYFFLYLVPQMVTIVIDFGTQLPAVTALVFTLARHWLWILLGGGLAVTAVAIAFSLLPLSTAGARLRERLILLLPGLGKVYRSSLLARFARSAALSAGAGHPLPLLLRLSAGATGSPLLTRDADRCAAAVEAGGNLTEVTLTTRLIPSLFGYMVHSAGQRNTLPLALQDLARTYDDQAYHRLSILRVILLPLMLGVVGGMLLLGIMALFLPLVSLINSLSGS